VSPRLHPAVGFLTLPPRRQPAEAEQLRMERSLCWVGPVIEGLFAALVVVLAVGVGRWLDSPWVAGAIFVLLIHGLRGFRRIDGFSDLAEAGLYQLSHPEASQQHLWTIVRAPQNGPYGTAVIVSIMLLEYSLIVRLVHFSAPEVVGAVVAVMLYTHAAMITAIAAPERVRPESAFVGFAREVSRPSRLVALWLTTSVLAAVVLGTSMEQWWWRTSAMLITLVITGAAVALGVRRVVVAVLGHLNGDVLGAAALTAECALLIVAAAFLSAR
jgi:cobalamin synthase